jgi:hypothetical protein
LVLARTNVGFNPGESWGVVFERSLASKIIAEQTTSDALTIAGRYRSLAALVAPDNDRAQPALALLRGLTRVDDETRRDYQTAFGKMLSSVDARTCAAIARDEIGLDEMGIALTYIPSTDMRAFLRAGDAAMSAERSGQPGPSLDERSVIAISERFIAQLGPKEQERYARIVTSDEKVSDDDECWRARVDHGGEGKLTEADANSWAMIVALTAVGRATPAPIHASATPPAAPAPDVRRNHRPQRGEPPGETPRGLAAPTRPQPQTSTAVAVVNPVPAQVPSARTTAPGNVPTGSPAPNEPNSRSAPAVETVATAPTAPAAPPPALTLAAGSGPADTARLSYARLVDNATAALRAGRNAEAGELIDQLIEADPARSEGWTLRGAMAMSVDDILPAAYE